MAHKVIEAFQTSMENPKGQHFWATFTTMSGMGTVMDWIPDIPGMIASVLGITLTWIMIRKGMADRRNCRLDSKKKELEIEILERKLDGSDAKLMRKTIKDTVEGVLGRRKDDPKDS
ncbi:hypothetical protein KAR91_78555 [Candidatus Pacearchaeota archaeon]|nr:hypothetical protein [Candidatus Pacearchaeota archaeon]